MVNGISSIFIHIDHHKARLSSHIIAGLLLIGGVGGLFTSITLGLLNKENDVGLGVSIFSAYTIVFFFVVEMWVLWQTLRTNFEQGHVIADFQELIQKLTEALRNLEDDIRQHYLNGSEEAFVNQRLYIAAPHFIFGLMSFPTHKIFSQYIESLRAVFKLAAELEEKNRMRLPIKIIFGSDEVITDWHRDRMKARFDTGLTSKDVSESEKKLNREFEKHIEDIFQPVGLDVQQKHFSTTDNEFNEKIYLSEKENCESSLPEQYFIRMKQSFEVQFMIVGGVLFEFTLNSQNDFTSIRDTQVVRDERTIRTYIAQFELLSRLALDESLIQSNDVEDKKYTKKSYEGECYHAQ
ncbi:hypothetical protein WLQ65_11835 [Pseudoalteromonas piscicida]|uniref:hypothetical protein n=1 Tax=Pseudoalteromonas piscicida TaxID=43662 RepID=UPI0030C8EFC5